MKVVENTNPVVDITGLTSEQASAITALLYLLDWDEYPWAPELVDSLDVLGSHVAYSLRENGEEVSGSYTYEVRR